MNTAGASLKQIFAFTVVATILALHSTAQTPTPVVVELFTSEGCSSCPPADKLLAELDRVRPSREVDVIVLSEHVDYWNRLGWTDPYSSEFFSARQQKYSDLLHSEVYTPQVVVDGHTETVGSRAAAVRAAIQKAARQAKLPISLTAVQKSGKIQVHVGWNGVEKLHDDVAVYLALAESKTQSQVRAGENSGEMLKHVAVVRKISAVGSLTAGQPFANDASFVLRPEWTGMRVIAFLQEKKSGRIIGAAQQKL
jgi:hypothetical protein